ncbi:hypothetical protein EHS25_002847 [Saitozyma podzolica]|uniref:DUF1764-domain-containing protein n=1 Tax=Saitozyma podzolica TaxID=1890683 RepID=A0A427YBX4_9TREE|nr:hypothetical protein EHS25_002847 [Saitozyma podzolica]
MAKKSAASKPGVSVPAASSGTSIDDIFSKPLPKKQSTAGHSKAAAVSASASSSSSKLSSATPKASSSTASAGPSESSKKKRKLKTVASFVPEEAKAASPVSAPAPEPSSRVVEVVDPSLAKVAAQVQPVKSEIGKTSKAGKKRDRKADEDDEAFRDSRGDGPRRKTEEGFLIYKEAELKIDPEAGGTPLCPFDCDCCF